MIKYKKQIGLLVVFIGIIVLVRFTPIVDYITLENVKEQREALRAFTERNYLTSAFLYVLLYILVVALSIPAAVPVTLAGGFLFGAVLTTVYVNIGATIGATLAFLAARYLLGNFIQQKYESQLARFNEELSRNGPRYMLTVRFMPLFPFFLINFLSGLTRVPLKTFIWTTSVGIIPGTAVYAFAGQQLGTINSIAEIVSIKVLSSFLLLAVFTIFPVLLNYAKRKNAQSH